MTLTKMELTEDEAELLIWKLMMLNQLDRDIEPGK